MEEKIIPCIIKIKRRVSGEAGPPPTLTWGEMGMNEVDQTLYIGTTNNQETSGNNTGEFGFF